MKCGEVNTVAFCTMKQEYVRKWSAGFQILYVFCEITSVCFIINLVKCSQSIY